MKILSNQSEAVDASSSRLLIQAASTQSPVTLTIHEYFLTLSDTPSLSTLSIKLGAGTEQAVLRQFGSTADVHQCVGAILNDYPVKPEVLFVQHFKKNKPASQPHSDDNSR